MTTFDQEIMARTAMGEARGEGMAGMIAVMWVGLNRYTSKKWYGGQTIAATFLKHMQFDCWMPADHNYQYIVDITDSIGLFAQALQWAEDIISGNVADPTQGATHYYADGIAAPAWAQGATPTVKIGRHNFYKDVA